MEAWQGGASLGGQDAHGGMRAIQVPSQFDIQSSTPLPQTAVNHAGLLPGADDAP